MSADENAAAKAERERAEAAAKLERDAAARKAGQPQQFEHGKTHYLQYRGKRKYLGEDPGDKSIGFDGKFLSVAAGEVVEVSSAKAKQLMRDFRNDWQISSDKEFEKSERDRLALEEKAHQKAEQQRLASVEREKREKRKDARAGTPDDDDDDFDDT